MNAQPRREGAPPRRSARALATHHTLEAGETAFDRWLQQELGKLYNATLSEPVPEELAELLRHRAEDR